MAAIIWEKDKVVEVLRQAPNAFQFARIKTPHGWRTRLKDDLKRKLEGHCFANSLIISSAYPDKFWYCEGFADGVPHAWISPKRFNGKPLEENWAIDVTWQWKPRACRFPLENINYAGLRVEGDKAREFLTNRMKDVGPTGVSLLKYYDEIDHLLG